MQRDGGGDASAPGRRNAGPFRRACRRVIERCRSRYNFFQLSNSSHLVAMSLEDSARAWIAWLSALTLGQIWAALCNPPDKPWKTAVVVAAFAWSAPEYYGRFKAWRRGRKVVKFVWPAPKVSPSASAPAAGCTPSRAFPSLGPAAAPARPAPISDPQPVFSQLAPADHRKPPPPGTARSSPAPTSSRTSATPRSSRPTPPDRTSPATTPARASTSRHAASPPPKTSRGRSPAPTPRSPNGRALRLRSAPVSCGASRRGSCGTWRRSWPSRAAIPARPGSTPCLARFSRRSPRSTGSSRMARRCSSLSAGLCLSCSRTRSPR